MYIILTGLNDVEVGDTFDVLMKDEGLMKCFKAMASYQDDDQNLLILLLKCLYKMLRVGDQISGDGDPKQNIVLKQIISNSFHKDLDKLQSKANEESQKYLTYIFEDYIDLLDPDY